MSDEDRHEMHADDVGSYLLGAMPDDEREAFEAHLAGCPRCRQDVEELRVAAEALPIAVPLMSPPAALRDRIMAVVDAEAELLAAAGRRADEPAAVPAPAPARRRAGWTSWLLRPVAAAAAAVVLLAAGALGGVLARGGGDEPSARTVAAQTTVPGAQVRLRVGEEASTLVARNMPAPPRGRVYQVWVKRPGRDPEPTSALWTPNRAGEADVAVPGSLDGVEAVLVTDEPLGGATVPSKTPVISASPA